VEFVAVAKSSRNYLLSNARPSDLKCDRARIDHGMTEIGTQETTGWMWRMGQLATSNLMLTDKCWTAVVTLVDALVPPS